jgi:hypothetical protein
MDYLGGVRHQASFELFHPPVEVPGHSSVHLAPSAHPAASFRETPRAFAGFAIVRVLSVKVRDG